MTQTSHAEREAANLARLRDLVRNLEHTSDMHTIAEVLTGEADRILCEGLGNAGASRYWRKFTTETCGRAVGDV